MRDSGADLGASAQDNEIGVRLQAIRKKQRLSISRLASISGVSVGMISQIERGKTNPSIKILDRLRIALGVALTALLEDSRGRETDIERDFVRRGANRPGFAVGDEGMMKELLSPSGAHDLQLMLITLPPGAVSEDVLLGDGEKAGMVLAGVLTIAVDGDEFVLNKGDSFQFKSHLTHSVNNFGNVDVRFLWIMNMKQAIAHI
jgi:transcriptional regulator with XRE-family HTH domain